MILNEEINKLMGAIHKHQTRIDKIRKECPHLIYEVVMYMWRPGAMHPQRICTECGDTIPGITYQEDKACWKDYRSPKTLAGTKITNNGGPNEQTSAVDNKSTPKS